MVHPDNHPSLIVRAARIVLPERIRGAAGRMWTRTPMLMHNLHWALLSHKAREKYVRERLLPDQSSWLFIVGTSNSGSTMLSRLIALHPAIRDLPNEGQFLTDAIACPQKMGHGRTWALNPELFRMTEQDDPAPALHCMFDWSRHYARRPGMLLEKSPPNMLRMRWLQANFTPARFIILTRDPYAVSEGIIRRRTDLTIDRAALQWVKAHEIMFDDLPMIERHLMVKYEQLSDDPESTLRQIETFLELPQPFDRELLTREFPVHNMDNKSSTITNFNQRSIARLSPQQIETVTSIAGAMMARLGYQPLPTT